MKYVKISTENIQKMEQIIVEMPFKYAMPLVNLLRTAEGIEDDEETEKVIEKGEG